MLGCEFVLLEWKLSKQWGGFASNKPYILSRRWWPVHLHRPCTLFFLQLVWSHPSSHNGRHPLVLGLWGSTTIHCLYLCQSLAKTGTCNTNGIWQGYGTRPPSCLPGLLHPSPCGRFFLNGTQTSEVHEVLQLVTKEVVKYTTHSEGLPIVLQSWTTTLAQLLWRDIPWT